MTGETWGGIVIAVLGLAGGFLAFIRGRKQDGNSAADDLMTQFRKELDRQGDDLEELRKEVRELRMREFAWITHTQDLTGQVITLGGTAKELPAILRSTT